MGKSVAECCAVGWMRRPGDLTRRVLLQSLRPLREVSLLDMQSLRDPSDRLLLFNTPSTSKKSKRRGEPASPSKNVGWFRAGA
jgi:hypothetical protein